MNYQCSKVKVGAPGVYPLIAFLSSCTIALRDYGTPLDSRNRKAR